MVDAEPTAPEGKSASWVYNAETQPGSPAELKAPVENDMPEPPSEGNGGKPKEPLVEAINETQQVEPNDIPSQQETPAATASGETPTPPSTPIQELPATAAPGKRVDAEGDQPNKKRPPSETLPDQNEDREDALFVASVPPEVLSERAIYMRLNRVFAKRKDGTYQLDDRWNNAWLDIDGGGRDELYSMFEKLGYKRDRFCDQMSNCLIFKSYVQIDLAKGRTMVLV